MARVLYIEDDEQSRQLIHKVLTSAGYEVSCAEDGISGLRKALTIKPDLILLDIQLPDMDGYEVTLALRNELGPRRVPILALTGAGSREMSLAVGCDAHLAKPIDVVDLVAAVRRHLGKTHDSEEEPSGLLLLAQGQKLASRLQAKIEELESANRRLLEAEKVRAEFYRNLSHELSTPLTPAVGYLNMLVNEELGPINPVQRKAIQAVGRSFQRMRAVVENLLDMTALTTGKMAFFARRYDFNAVAAESLVLCQHRFADREIAVENALAREPYPAHGDPDRLKRAMVQLLENAAKFCAASGRVHVATRRLAGQLAFLVYDSGQGIPEAELEAIFKTFYQVDGSPTREHGGAGLGLALARKIVERLGGEVWAESPPRGEGPKLAWARTLVALRVPETMPEEGGLPPGPSR